MSANPLPAVDVVVPAFNEEGHVDRCLDAIFAQDYPQDRYRVWVVDAGSTDATAGVVLERAAAGPPARARERAGPAERGPGLQPRDPAGQLQLIARVDAHTYLYPDYLRRAAELLEEEGPAVCCVGAQPEQVGETPFGEAVALARGSSFGVGASVYADERTRADVDTIQAGVYRRAPLEEVGGFRTDMLVGEDEELNWRLKKAGYRLVLDTSVRFVYTTRSSWRRRVPPAPQLRPVARPRAGRPSRLPPALPPRPSGHGGRTARRSPWPPPSAARARRVLGGLAIAYAGGAAGGRGLGRAHPAGSDPAAGGMLPGAALRLRGGDDRGRRAVRPLPRRARRPPHRRPAALT